MQTKLIEIRAKLKTHKVKFYLKKYKIIFGIFLVWLVLLLAVGHFSQSLSKWPGLKSCGNKFDPAYYRWDSGWYTEISQKGYSFSPDRQSSTAFWPLYPLAIRVAHKITSLRPGKVAFDLSILFAFLATIVIYRLARLDYTEKTSRYIILFVLFWPASYFLVAVYPESLFRASGRVEFVLGETRKMAACRNRGAVFWRSRNPMASSLRRCSFWNTWPLQKMTGKYFSEKRNWLPLLLPFVSVVSFSYYNYLKFGNAFAYLQTEKNWGRGYGNFVVSLVREGREFLIPPTKLARRLARPIHNLSREFFLLNLGFLYELEKSAKNISRFSSC